MKVLPCPSARGDKSSGFQKCMSQQRVRVRLKRWQFVAFHREGLLAGKSSGLETPIE